MNLIDALTCDVLVDQGHACGKLAIRTLPPPLSDINNPTKLCFDHSADWARLPQCDIPEGVAQMDAELDDEIEQWMQ